MVFVYVMVTGVNGHHGVIVTRVLRRCLEQESVTTQHLAIEVHHVLGLQFRNKHVKVVNIAPPGMTQCVELMGRLMIMIAWLHVRGFLWIVTGNVLVVQYHHQEIGVNGHHGVIVTRLLRRCLEQESVTNEKLEMELHHVLGLQLRHRIVLQIVTIAATGMTQYVELMGRSIKMIAGLHVIGFLWIVTANVLVMLKTAQLIMIVTSLVRHVTGGPGAPVPVGMVFVYVMVTGGNGHHGVIVTRVLRRCLEQESVTTQHLAMEVHHVLGLQFRNKHVKVVNIAPPSMTQCVELMGRLMIMIALLHVRGFLWTVTRYVLVVQYHHREIGVNGHHGVIVTRLLTRCLEQESVTNEKLG